MSKRYRITSGDWLTRGEMIERRDELKKIIADLEHDLEIARRAVPDLEAACKVARDLAVVRNLEFMLGLAQAECEEIERTTQLKVVNDD